MNSKQLLAAMNHVSDEYILSVQRALGYGGSSENGQNASRIRILRKPLVFAAVIIILTGALFTTALAVSDELRNTVFAFFSAEEPGILPDDPALMPSESMTVEDERILIGDMIEGTYIHFPVMSSARNGVFRVCTDDVQMNSGNHYDAYYEANGEFVRLDECLFSQTYHLFGQDIPVEFEWAEYDGEVVITFREAEAPFVMFSGSGEPSAVLMWLAIDPPGQESYGYYPVQVNLRTGELTDICAGMGVEALPQIRQAAISQDRLQMLIVDWDGNLYFADLKERNLHAVDDLLGARASACVLADGKLIAWSDHYGTCSVRVFDPATWESRETYAGHPEFISGFDSTVHGSCMYLGTRFVLEIDSQGCATAIDLLDGSSSVVDGLEIKQGKGFFTECVPSPDGTKLLLYTRGQTSYYETIGVLDFSDKVYVSFSRENVRDVNEHAVYWFDDNSVMVEAHNPDGEKAFYLYRITQTQK
jgi:hypothetical protein